MLCSRVFRLPGEQKAVLTIPKKNSRKVRRKVGISTTQHGSNFTENSQRQNQTHRTFSAKILKPGLKIVDSSWNCQYIPGKMPIFKVSIPNSIYIPLTVLRVLCACCYNQHKIRIFANNYKNIRNMKITHRVNYLLII